MRPNVADWRIPLRQRLGIPDAVTGRGVTIGLLSVFFPSHPIIADDAPSRRIRWVDLHGRTYDAAALTASHPEMGQHDLAVAAHAAGRAWPRAGSQTGVAPDCDLYLSNRYVRAGKVCPADDPATVDAQLDLALAVTAKEGLRVATIGTKGHMNGRLLPWQWDSHRRRCEQLADRGVLVISGTGNTPGSFCPQGLGPSILCVGGLMMSAHTGKPEFFHQPEGRSFEGKMVPDVLAPAEPVLVASMDPSERSGIRGVPRGYTLTEGTSFAAPVIAGLAACLLQARPDATSAQIRWALHRTAKLVRPRLGRANVGMPDWRTSLRVLDAAPQIRSASPFAVYQAVQQMGWSETMRRLETHPAETLVNCLPQSAPRCHWRMLSRLFKATTDARARAAIVLLCRDDEPGASPLVEFALHDRSQRVLGAALEIIRTKGQADDHQRSRIRNLINHPDHAVRYEAIRAAQVIRDESFLEPLVKGMPMDLDRWQWASFLGRMQCLDAMTGERKWPRSRGRLLPGECVNSPYWMLKRRICAARWSAWLAQRSP